MKHIHKRINGFYARHRLLSVCFAACLLFIVCLQTFAQSAKNVEVARWSVVAAGTEIDKIYELEGNNAAATARMYISNNQIRLSLNNLKTGEVIISANVSNFHVDGTEQWKGVQCVRLKGKIEVSDPQGAGNGFLYIYMPDRGNYRLYIDTTNLQFYIIGQIADEEMTEKICYLSALGIAGEIGKDINAQIIKSFIEKYGNK